MVVLTRFCSYFKKQKNKYGQKNVSVHKINKTRTENKYTQNSHGAKLMQYK